MSTMEYRRIQEEYIRKYTYINVYTRKSDSSKALINSSSFHPTELLDI